MVSHFMKSTQHSGLPKQMLTRETLHLWSAQEPPHPCSNPQQCFAAPTVSNRCHGPLSQCWSLGAQTIKSAFTTLNAGRCRQLSSQITRQRHAWTAALQMITSSFLLVTRMASSAFMTWDRPKSSIPRHSSVTIGISHQSLSILRSRMSSLHAPLMAFSSCGTWETSRLHFMFLKERIWVRIRNFSASHGTVLLKSYLEALTVMSPCMKCDRNIIRTEI